MSNQKITELEEQVVLMQKEIERLKQNNDSPSVSSHVIYEKYKEQIETVRDKMFNAYGEIVHMENLSSITTYVSVGKDTRDGKIKMLCTGTAIFGPLDDLNEEGLSAALDVFTNPRRISILKVLAKGDMSAPEIGQITNLKSGQLHHHLSTLESAKLIVKTADKYKVDDRVQGWLYGLFAIIGNMEITRS